MKYLLLSLCLFTFLNLNAQIPSNNTEEDQVEYTCDQLKYDSKNNSMEMIGTVNMKTEKLEIKNASKITYNQKTKEIKAIGSEMFLFDGTIIVSETKETKTIRYIVGEDVAYLE
jgi:lipopolysaccharide export system protein LptA